MVPEYILEALRKGYDTEPIAQGRRRGISGPELRAAITKKNNERLAIQNAGKPAWSLDKGFQESIHHARVAHQGPFSGPADYYSEGVGHGIKQAHAAALKVPNLKDAPAAIAESQAQHLPASLKRSVPPSKEQVFAHGAIAGHDIVAGALNRIRE